MSGLFLNIRLPHKINRHNYRWRLQAVPPPPHGMKDTHKMPPPSADHGRACLRPGFGRTFPDRSNGPATSVPGSFSGRQGQGIACWHERRSHDRQKANLPNSRSKAAWRFSGRNRENRKDDMQDVKFSGNRAAPSRCDRSSDRGRARMMERAGTHADIGSQHCRAPVFQQPGHRETAFAKVIGK